MITLITGTPGAGKTLYAISDLILPLIGSTVTRTNEDGIPETLPRTIYTNINGAMFEHELIGPGGDWGQDPRNKEWVFSAVPGTEGKGLRDWHLWAKPGSIIVYDEFQKVWPPRANGSPVPPDLQALDTHRHMGVDFILPTQSPNNFDRHVQGLVGRHLHVRRMGNLPLTIIYEWDHCSKSLLYSKSLAKRPWRYNKKVYKLYKSAEVHTKQPRRIPTLLYFVGAAMLAAFVAIPNVVTRLQERMSGPVAHAAQPQNGGSAIPGQTGGAAAEPVPFDYTAFVPRVSSQPNSAPAYDELRKVVNLPRVAGAICNSKRCQCLTEQGTDTGMSDQECSDWMKSRPYDAYTPPPAPATVEAKSDTKQAPPVGQLDLRF
jgi:zona occludens toxin